MRIQEWTTAQIEKFIKLDPISFFFRLFTSNLTRRLLQLFLLKLSLQFLQHILFHLPNLAVILSVHLVTRARRRQQRQEKQPRQRQPQRRRRRRRTFLDMLPGPAGLALFGFLLSVKCNAHVTTTARSQGTRRRCHSDWDHGDALPQPWPFLIIFQSCPRPASAAAIRRQAAEAAPPLSVLFVFCQENYYSTQRGLKVEIQYATGQIPVPAAGEGTPLGRIPSSWQSLPHPKRQTSTALAERILSMALKYLSALNQDRFQIKWG